MEKMEEKQEGMGGLGKEEWMGREKEGRWMREGVGRGWKDGEWVVRGFGDLIGFS